MSEDKPMAFEREREIKKTKGLKFSGKPSTFQKSVLDKKEAQQAKESFEKKADDFMQHRQEQQAKGVDIAKRFMTAFRDKTLVRNKGILNKEEEKELREEFQHLILDLNNDPEQKYDGMGSVSGIALILKSLFEMRDRVNELEYELAVLRKKNASSTPE